MRDIMRHPCFNAAARSTSMRAHLPVAPRCNMQCRFCNRDFDCVNESRPGVTSAVLSPSRAADYLDSLMRMRPEIAVAGIAGPGDPFANAEETLQTLRLVRERHPTLLLCLATNGMELLPYVGDLSVLGVDHVTVTVNAVDPSISASIYAWLRFDGRTRSGIEACERLLERQLASIRALKGAGIQVKVNAIAVPGINDRRIPDVARTVAALGADLFNCMPMYASPGAEFGTMANIDAAVLNEIRRRSAVHLPQSAHCARCRADAVGFIGERNGEEVTALLSACAGKTLREAGEGGSKAGCDCAGSQSCSRRIRT